jgi:1,4-alpha-glucan branching enzyme
VRDVKKNTADKSMVSPEELDAFIEARHDDPFHTLGMRRVGKHLAVRSFLPDAAAVNVLDASAPSRKFPTRKIHEAGFFAVQLPEGTTEFPYLLEITNQTGATRTVRDPYSFGRILGETDVHLHAEGNHWELYQKFGAHLATIDGVSGTVFCVWAPNAQRVSVVGDFNGWDGRVHPMRRLMDCGIWEIFLPGVGEGAHYKFEIKGCDGNVFLKSDPFAFYSQHGLQTASIVYNLDRFAWSDQAWMKQRTAQEWHKKPVSIYEVHLGSWQRVIEEENRPLSYLELADRLIPYCLEMGFTHLELMPVAEHPYDGSWGYQVAGYYAPTSRFGNPDEFRHFVDRCHEAGLGVILDWVPAHFPKDAHGLAMFDGTHLYEHADPRQGEHSDWGTYIFNYGRNEVRNFLIANALFWFDQYHIDGLRVDAVASMLYLDYSREPGEWVPNCHGGRENLEAIHFLKRFNEVSYERFPGIMTIAEESTAWPGVTRPTFLGGLGFGFKWNMGWMHDSLHYMSLDPVYRRYHQGSITFSLLYAFHEHFILVLSHDEVVHGKGSLIDKMPGDEWQKFANLRMFYAWMWAHPGKKLLFQGGEFGQWQEWRYQESLDWHLTEQPLHSGLRRLVQHLNHFYQTHPALYELDDSPEGFSWLDFHDSDNSVVAFARKSSAGQTLVFAVNATPVIRQGYRIGVPERGFYREILNTDAEVYGGSNVGNFGGVSSNDIPWQGQSHSLQIELPPLSVVGFVKE